MSTYNSTHTGQEIDNFNSRITTLENTTIPNLNTKITTLENTTIPNLDTRITTLDTRITDLEKIKITYITGHNVGSYTVTSGNGIQISTDISISSLTPDGNSDASNLILIFRHANGLLLDNYWNDNNGNLVLYMVNPCNSSRTMTEFWGYAIGKPKNIIIKMS